MSSHGWDTAELVSRFLLNLGRGNGGEMQADELWTPARVYQCLADAQEAVYTRLMPKVPHVFVSAPVRLTSSDGGVTYDFPTWPFGHTEVYAQENGGRVLYGASYGDVTGDFVFEGNVLRAPGNRTRTYANGPYARYAGFPLRIAANQEPTMQPPPSRELILYQALIMAADVFGAQYDAAPWQQRYATAEQRWLLNWKTQLTAPQAGTNTRTLSWQQVLSAWNS